MSRTIEAVLPSCDVEVMDLIAQRTGSEFGLVVEACTIRGMFELCRMTIPLNRDQIEEWCMLAHTLLGESLAEVE